MNLEKWDIVSQDIINSRTLSNRSIAFSAGVATSFVSKVSESMDRVHTLLQRDSTDEEIATDLNLNINIVKILIENLKGVPSDYNFLTTYTQETPKPKKAIPQTWDNNLQRQAQMLREQLVSEIEANPGIELKELAKVISRSPVQTKRHLHKLRFEEKIKYISGGYFTCQSSPKIQAEITSGERPVNVR